MGLNAVQNYSKTLVNGLSSPLYQRSLEAYITPPNPGKLPGPAAYVWVTRGTNNRQTAPRGPGFRQTVWTVNIWLMAPGKATDINADSAFACLIDAVVESWVTTPMPIPLTDPETGLVTQIVSVGEEFTIDQSPVHSLADQRLFLYEALIQFTVKEIATP